MDIARWTILVALASLPVPGLAAADSAPQVLESVGFLGRWSQHCDRGPAPDNILRTTSVMASGAIGFTEEIGKDYGKNVYEVLSAERIDADNIAIKIRLNDKITETLVMTIESERVRTMSNHVLDGENAGRDLVTGGRITASGTSTPWLSRCRPRA
jgi:hypothetical protein